MPKTKGQETVFGILMVLAMVYGMEVYNVCLERGGVAAANFFVSPLEMLPLCIAAFALETAIVGPLAHKLVAQVVNPGKSRPFTPILLMSLCTVCMMCPLMSFVAAVWFQGPGNLVWKWLPTLGRNLPMALCWQLFVAGPVVRRLFGALCRARR